MIHIAGRLSVVKDCPMEKPIMECQDASCLNRKIVSCADLHTGGEAIYRDMLLPVLDKAVGLIVNRQAVLMRKND